jgi:hypothetical protein
MALRKRSESFAPVVTSIGNAPVIDIPIYIRKEAVLF